MSYSTITPFELNDFNKSDELINKVHSLSGYHLCFWEYNPINKKSKILSAYGDLEGVQFHDFSWPQKFVTPEAWGQYCLALDTLLSNNKTLDVVMEFKTFGKWIRIITRFVKEKKIFEGIVKDVTREHITDTVLRNRTLELSAYDEGLDKFSIVARTDANGKITYANNEFCRLSKYSCEELIGKDHRIVNSGHHPKEFFKEMWGSIKKGVSWRGLLKNKAKDGTFYWVDTIIIPIRDECGELIEMLSFRFDVTVMMSYQEEIDRLKEEIAQLKMKSDFS